jgi:lysophospholipase L1-like esterase
VLNLGVPGFTSRQGLELIRSEVLAYQPDLVTFGYGSNGRFWPGVMTDDANIKFNQTSLGGAAILLKRVLDRFYSYRLVRKLVTAVVYRLVDRGASHLNMPHRVTLEGIRDAIIAAHAEVGQVGARLMVLNLDIAKTDAREGMKMGVAETGADYLDLRELFDQARRDRSLQIETEQGLPAVKPSESGSLLRVRAPKSPGVSLYWRAFFSTTSSVDPMWDDGTHGDQLAGDGIWSLSIPQPADQRVLYAYWRTEEGHGEESHASGDRGMRGETGRTREFEPGSKLGGRWRMELVPDSRVMDIDDFGVYFLHTDNSHPDEAGHRLIAEALLPAVLEIERKNH